MPYLGLSPAVQTAAMAYQDLTGGTGTSFTLDYPVGNAAEIEVFVNNVRQEPTVAYTVSGTSLSMTGSIVATDDFYVNFQGKALVTSTGGGGGGTFKGNNGEVNAGGGDIFRVHQQQLNTNTTVDADENALAAGPLTVATGVTLTVTTGGSLVIA
jgi:hypothetical protein